MSNTQTAKNHANKDLYLLTSGKYFNEVPLDDIFSIVRSNAGEVLDVDNTPLSGVILCGESGTANFSVQNMRSKLHIAWYTMPSGRYEIIAYIS